MKILFVGTPGAFSLPPLQALLQSEHTIAAVVVPPDSANISGDIIPLLPPHANHTIITLAQSLNIPVIPPRDAPETDAIVVACFPRRLSANFLSRARRAALNIHPSWLPQYRGPAPVFWQLRDGVTAPGVTLHRMTAELDAGNIVAQSCVQLPAGASGPQIDQLLAGAGAQLLQTALTGGELTGSPQPPGGSYQSWPQADDWTIPCGWRAERAFNFMRGTEEWDRPYRVQTNAGEIHARRALRMTLGPAKPGRVEKMHSGWTIDFAGGQLVVE